MGTELEFDLSKICFFDSVGNIIYLQKHQEPRVVVDGDYTIYYNEHGEKTVVKRMDSEDYDLEKAVMFALLKSRGVKPKDVVNLVENAIDNKAKREERERKKELKRKEKLAKEEKVSDDACDETYCVYYQDFNVYTKICECNSLYDAYNKVNELIQKRHKQSPYMRIWAKDGKLFFGYGSHKNFYYIKGSKPIENITEELFSK